ARRPGDADLAQARHRDHALGEQRSGRERDREDAGADPPRAQAAGRGRAPLARRSRGPPHGTLAPPARPRAAGVAQEPAHGAAPTTRTSGSSRLPVARATAPCASAISATTSPAVAWSTLAMKFAWIGEISAPPMRRPLRPTDSISLPAKSPGGFLN